MCCTLCAIAAINFVCCTSNWMTFCVVTDIVSSRSTLSIKIYGQSEHEKSFERKCRMDGSDVTQSLKSLRDKQKLKRNCIVNDHKSAMILLHSHGNWFEWCLCTFFWRSVCKSSRFSLHKREKSFLDSQWLFCFHLRFTEEIIINQWQFAIDLWHDNTRQWRLTAKSNFFPTDTMKTVAREKESCRGKFCCCMAKVFWLKFFVFAIEGVRLECKFFSLCTII